MGQKPHEDSLQFLENKSLDANVRPKIMRRGMLGKDSTGTWRNLLVNSDGSLERRYEYMGKITVGDYSYFGFKERGTAHWKVMRKNNEL